MSDTTFAGKASPWTYQGKDYLLGATDLELELVFQAAHEAWARQRIEATREKVGDRLYTLDVDRFGERRDANRFAFGGPLCLQWLCTPAGQLEYLFLKLQKGASEGGERISRTQLQTIQREDNKAWDALANEVLQREFPLVFGPGSEAPATP